MPCCSNLPPTTASALPNLTPRLTGTRYAASSIRACDQPIVLQLSRTTNSTVGSSLTAKRMVTQTTGGMSKFIAHLKTVIPQHHLPRHRQDGELQPAHWTHMTLLPGVMVYVSQADDVSNGYQGKPNQQHPQPEWWCAKFLCLKAVY